MKVREKKYLSKWKRFYRKIYTIFYILEVIPFTSDLIPITGEILYRLAPKDRDVKKSWRRWIMDHRPQYSDILTFGQFKGESISDVPDSYISWMVEACDLPDIISRKVKILSMFNYETLGKYYAKGNGLYTTMYLIRLYESYFGECNQCFPISSRSTYYNS